MTEFILCLLLILTLARIVGKIMQYIGQPRVVGEMLAGLILGPSVLGMIFPEVFSLFSTKFNDVLYLLSQLGLALYMFVVGLELDSKVFKKDNLRQSLVIAISGILFVFVLTFVSSLYLYYFFELPNISRVNFAVFMACGFSLTAFPMLARILQERRLSNSKFGAITLVAASLDDALAWVLLAFMMAVISADGFIGCLIIFISLVVYIFVMLFVVKPILSKYIYGKLGQSKFAVILIVFLGSILAADFIGIHAVFGGFIAGIIIPRDSLIRSGVELRLRDFVTVFLVPIFFVYSGMNTSLSFFSDPLIIIPMFLYIIIATLGKYVIVTLISRRIGFTWRDSNAIGALMNARGLMILIFGNIGISQNLISTEVYSIIVVVAIVTTSMTYPLFNLSFSNNGNMKNRMTSAYVADPEDKAQH